MPSPSTQNVRHSCSVASGSQIGGVTGDTQVVPGLYTSAGYLLSKQQLLVTLTLCGLCSGAGNTPENTVDSQPN